MHELVEKLAELEHEQWMAWTYSIIVKLEKGMDSSYQMQSETARANFLVSTIQDIIKNWDKNRVEYSKLTEEVKEKDREWARKVVEVINKER